MGDEDDTRERGGASGPSSAALEPSGGALGPSGGAALGPSGEVVIRRAAAGDLAQAAALAGRLVRQHHEADPRRFFMPENVERGYASWFGRELRRREAVVLVAAVGDEIVGYCYGALEERDWNRLLEQHGAIHDLLVAEAARRRGAGAALLAAMVAALEGLGAERIVLTTRVANIAAQRLFERAGFRPTLLEMTRG